MRLDANWLWIYFATSYFAFSFALPDSPLIFQFTFADLLFKLLYTWVTLASTSGLINFAPPIQYWKWEMNSLSAISAGTVISVRLLHPVNKYPPLCAHETFLETVNFFKLAQPLNDQLSRVVILLDMITWYTLELLNAPVAILVTFLPKIVSGIVTVTLSLALAFALYFVIVALRSFIGIS